MAMATRVTATVRRDAPRSSELFLEETSASFNKLSDGDAAARLNETLARIDLDLDAASRRRHLASFSHRLPALAWVAYVRENSRRASSSHYFAIFLSLLLF